MKLLERLRRLPPNWRQIRYRGFRVAHLVDEDLVSHVQRSAFEERSIRRVASWHGLGRVGIDVGANIGFFTLGVIASALERGHGEGRIVALEPNPRTLSRLVFTIEDNRLGDRVEALALALSDYEGMAEFFVHRGRSSSGDGLRDTGRAGPTTVVPVPVTRLDTLWSTLDFERLDWIKLDVEGAELRVLQGAAETLSLFRPRLLFEAHPLNLAAHGIEPSDLFEWLEESEYRVQDLEGTDLCLENFTAKVERREENFVALPAEADAD